MWKRLLVVAATGLMTACSSHNPKNMGTQDLAHLKNLYSIKTNTPEVSALRVQSLQDAAMSLGAQSGLAWRAAQINQILQDKSKLLDQAFNFNGLMLGAHVLPPVLVTTDKSIKIDSVDTIRLSDQTYKILAQAKFVSVPPTWRDYLLMNYDFPPYPAENMLPTNALEQQMWRDAVAIGWQQGIQQADNIFSDDLARLTRDIKGMALYRKLLNQGMVSQPFVAKSSLGITGSGEEMTINDQVMRIMALPQLQTDSKQWHPVVVKESQASQDFADE